VESLSESHLARPLQSSGHRRNGLAEMPSGRLKMTTSVSSFAAQLGVGFVSFLVSATCILAAVGPAYAIA
jgi:hypothetical protein